MRFFMIDRILNWQVGVSARAVKNISLSEDFFDDHFPRRPVMPGVLIIEGMAQLSGLLLEDSIKLKSGKDAKAVLTILERTKFREMVRPGDTLEYVSEVMSVNENGGKVSVSAFLNDRQIVTTGMVFAFKYVDDPQLEVRRKELMKVWLA